MTRNRLGYYVSFYKKGEEAMKTAIILLASLTAFGCATSRLEPQPLEEASVTLSEHLDKVALSRAFCGGEEIAFYHESTVSYIITCKGGPSFSLRK